MVVAWSEEGVGLPAAASQTLAITWTELCGRNEHRRMLGNERRRMLGNERRRMLENERRRMLRK